MSMRKLPRFLLFTTALLLPDLGAQLYIIGYPPNVECLEDDDIARRLKGEFHILIYDPTYPMRRVVLILAFIPAVVLAQAKEYYGAIAYSLGTGAHGWANDHPSRAAAEKAALANCRKFAKDCKAVVWFKNACGAIAVGSKGYGWGWGEKQAAAEIEALKSCSKHTMGCTVHRHVCTSH
jgi:hypothetical protein